MRLLLLTVLLTTNLSTANDVQPTYTTQSTVTVIKTYYCPDSYEMALTVSDRHICVLNGQSTTHIQTPDTEQQLINTPTVHKAHHHKRSSGCK